MAGSVVEPPLFWAAPAPAPGCQGPGADSGSDLLGSAPAPGKKRRLRLPAPTNKKIGSGAALKVAAPGGSGSATLLAGRCYHHIRVNNGCNAVDNCVIIATSARVQGPRVLAWRGLFISGLLCVQYNCCCCCCSQPAGKFVAMKRSKQQRAIYNSFLF